MKHRIISLIIFMLTLLTVISSSACGSNPEGNNEVSTTATTSITPETTALPEETFDVPEDLDFAGAVFNVLSCDENVPYTYFEDFTNETGEVMNDAIYLRNRKTEEFLGIKINIQNVSGIVTIDLIHQDVLSGDVKYDMVSPHIIRSVTELVTQGYAVDLNELNYVDFSKSWWNGGFVDTMSIKGKTFYASGDMIAPNVRVIVFNKKMMEDNHFPDIYETVRSGKWTLDTLGTYTARIYSDLNGDAKMDALDQYAFSDLSNTGLSTSFVHASDMLFVVKDGEGFRLTLNDEKMYIILDKLYNYLYRDNNITITNEAFGEGRVLFGSQVLLKLQILRSYSTEFGIIPFPKYDEEQTGYFSSVWNGLVSVPVTAKNMDMSGAVLETLAFFSQDTLVPAYYENLLGGKFAQDDTSVEMLDLIFNGIVYDIGLCYDNFTGNYSSIGKLLKQGSTDLASWYKTYEKVFAKNYQNLFDSIG